MDLACLNILSCSPANYCKWVFGLSHGLPIIESRKKVKTLVKNTWLWWEISLTELFIADTSFKGEVSTEGIWSHGTC